MGIIKWVSALSSVASIVSLAFVSEISHCLRIVIGIVGIACFIALIVAIHKENQVNERICKSDEDIKKAMLDLIKVQGKICIVSRDLSWVDETVLKAIIAKRDSMLIFVQRENDTTRTLSRAGVSVKYYGQYNFEPKTRFTAIRYNRDNAQIAIADTQSTIRKRGKFKHTIYETSTSKQDKWINSLALDMISLFNAVCKE